MVAVTAHAGEPARLNIGAVVSSVWRVLWRRSVTILLVGLPFVFLPNCLAAFLPSDVGALKWAAGLPGLVFVGGVTLLAHRELTGGERVGAGQAIRAGVSNFGKLWGVAVVSNLATLIGLVLLLVPGFIVLLGWMTASAAAVVEGHGVFDSLDRAWTLSRGQRWRLLALLGIGVAVLIPIFVLIVVILIVLTLIVGERYAGVTGDFVVSPLLTIVFTAITTVGCIAAFVGLKEAKEGDAGGLATIFD
jgi:hypothetical protein